MDNDYQSKFSSSIVEKSYLNDEFADFHFIFKINDDQYERIPAHKFLLAGSDVFRVMFNGDWKDKTEVEIVDASVAAFKEFLQFFYLSQVNLTMENVGFVMNLANKYNARECFDVCCKFLTNSIIVDNVCTVYALAKFFDQHKLSKYCEIVIETDTKAVLSSNGFLECDRKILKYILDLDFISCSEADVFDAYMNWVKLKAGQEHLTREIVQTQLGDVFYGFRFKAMSPTRLVMLLSSYGKVCSFDEIIEINQLIAIEEFEPTIFSKKQRKPINNFLHYGMDVFCDRMLSYSYSAKPYQIKELEVTTFSVDVPLLLKKLRFDRIHEFKNCGYYNSKENMATEIEIAQFSPEQILLNQKATINRDKDTDMILSQPILIRPNLMYEIRLKQKPPTNCASGLLFKSKVQLDSDITVEFHRDPTILNDSIARGLIRSLTFTKM